MPTKIMHSQSQYQSMVNFEKMESLVDVTYDAPDVSMKVTDGAAFVNVNRPKSSTTYGKYCEDELLSKLKFTFQNTKRLDLVFDVYNESSQTR